MVQYRDLNAPPSRMLADVVADMKAQERQSKTGDAGVKDLGEAGDVVWPRPDGTAVSVRDVDLDLADARQRIEDAEGTLGETGQRLADAEQAVSDAVASIDGKLDESALDDPATSGRLAASMTDVTRHLIVTDSAILNHATLIGQTVVDDINVQGKLIGTDGVFTGTVDFTNVNVTGTQIVNKLGANSISADKISGGSFSGNTFTGGTFSGSSFIGATYATSSRPGTLGGVMIDPTNGLRAWAPTGTLSVQISPSDGRLKAVNSDGRGVILIPTTSTGGGGLWFSHTGGGGSSDAAIWRSGYAANVREPLNLRGANGDGVNVYGGLVMQSGNLDAGFGLFDSGLTVSGRITHYNAPTTSSGANALIATNPEGVFYRSTSSRRYKRNIVDWNPAPEAVLALQPRQWQHDDPAHPEDIDETWHPGFIAEEVHDLGLRHLVKYVGDGKGGWIPDGLNYDRFASAQQVVLRKHEAEINELRERIALLEQNQEHQ